MLEKIEESDLADNICSASFVGRKNEIFWITSGNNLVEIKIPHKKSIELFNIFENQLISLNSNVKPASKKEKPNKEGRITTKTGNKINEGNLNSENKKRRIRNKRINIERKNEAINLEKSNVLSENTEI